MSRQFKAYASAYQQRDHEARLTKGEVRQYACDLNGALDGETVASATWDTSDSRLSLSGLDVTGGIATVTATASECGCAVMRLQATTSTGRKIDQRFVVTVRDTCSPSSTLSWP